MGDDAVEYYQWVLSDPAWHQALCVTYGRCGDEAAMITAFGGDPAATMRAERLHEVLDGYHYSRVPPAVLVVSVGDWQIGIEENGFEGSRPEVLRRVAGAEFALSVYWNVNGHTRFSYSRGGRTQVGFDMESVDDRYGDDPHALDEHLAGLPFGLGDDAHPYAAGLALAERVTGVRLDADLLDRDLRGAILQRVPADLVHESNVGHPALDDPFIRYVLTEPTVDKLPAIIAYQAGSIARDGGIDDEPVIREVIAAITEPAAAPSARLRERINRLEARYAQVSRAEGGRAGQDSLRRLQAVQDVARAAFPDLRRATRTFIPTYQIRDSSLRLQCAVLEQCAYRAVQHARDSQ